MSLGSRFAAELSALYQPFSFRQSNVIGVISSSKTTGSLWQFPLLLKYRILEGPIAPYIAAGPSFQLVTNITENSITILAPATVVSHPQPDRRLIAGFAAGAGFGFSLGLLRISPEVRYTRWAAENFNFTESNHVGTNLNQVQLLVAFLF